MPQESLHDKKDKQKTIAQQERTIDAIRKDFPIFEQQVYGKPLVYLDNAATTHKPYTVIDAINRFYAEGNANIHRGIYFLSEQATTAYEQARKTVAKFINAPDSKEIIFVRGTTEAINLVAQSFGRMQCHKGDTILVTHLEHHANIVPWQILAEQIGIRLEVVPMDENGILDWEVLEQKIALRPKLFSIVHLSNVLGVLNPVKEMIALAHQAEVPVLLDAAQSTPHFLVDVQELDCDFLAFSSHKLFGPTGIGVLYGKAKWLDKMPPYQGGGDMIHTVSFEKTTFNPIPARFEAGTPNIAGAIGLAAAINYLQGLEIEKLHTYEEELYTYAEQALSTVEGLEIKGKTPNKAGALSFTLNGAHPHDIATLLDLDGIAIRAGHQCAQPIMQRLGVTSLARASLCFYNKREEIDKLVYSLKKIANLFH